ncbi:MAG: YbjN domain-containing protein, partial [Lachnospiraceae bacterium]|nr:YbjN domain-containing protein [Lachnospiraceae bacterium]
MANQAVQLFTAFMEAQDCHVEVMEDNENVCRMGFKMDNTNALIFVQFSEDGTDAAFIGLDFIQIPETKEEIVYKICNECNDKFRWVKFVWNQERKEVICQADAVIQLDSCAEECFEIV